MAMGKPIVSSDSIMLRDFIKHEKNGLLFKMDAVEDLKVQLFQLIKDKNLRAQLGKNARRDVVKYYTWDKNLERILKNLVKFKYLCH